MVSRSTVGGQSQSLRGGAPKLLGLLLPVRLAPGDVPGLDLQRQLPQRLLGQVVAEVVEEADDVFVPLQLVMPEMTSTDQIAAVFYGHLTGLNEGVWRNVWNVWNVNYMRKSAEE